MLDRLAGRQFIEGRVGQRSLAGTELAQDGGGLVLVQPAQHGIRSLAGGQVLVQGLQLGTDLAGVTAEQFAQPCSQAAPRAGTRAELALLPAGRARTPERRLGPGAGRAERR